MNHKNLSIVLVGLLAAVSSPALAQQPQSPAVTVPEALGSEGASSGPLTGTVTADAWNDLGIAIASFATNEDVPTAANASGTAALGHELARVVYNDLRNNGLFRPVGPDALPRPSFTQITNPAWPTWRGRSAEMLVQGYVRPNPDGRLTVGCYLYDVVLEDELIRDGWVVAPADWRRAAHRCADMVYSRLSGESPFFDSRIAYIAETGPKENRVKRLAIMDSDGANHRFITNGQSTALTPRYSPDYTRIAYLSYADGNPRIYIYDIDSGRQRLVAETGGPTFAPRWSPDGRYILYSMATAGNTDIYRVPAAGGTPLRLTTSPSIEVGGSYSPDGSQIVFESDQSGTQQCYIMNADGSNQRRISFFGGRCATPEWSPRGDQIAFTHIVGDFHIGVMDTNGRNMRTLTNGWQDEAPTWAPNGRIIQFFRTERNSGETSIWQVDLTGRNERRLNTPVGASDPAWGPVLP
ncbi:Tol-Pal system beta propeller repeat protein TolB [Altererythrobacter sp. KTW20L]|uniref:Tol-Pal system beta propeller repeat protein TolB n=1 Tax=Altererythrobacter sp. KTW20L TaxID=2942210 RepID=UPI0020BD5D1E|nr:Tol-Pal system beta propeller repeat protein TolB [Altererythrobacter sp. KTW20L]MCL6250539.1 Tol-Pal system beta propeller repeat protein TolB [Altererythrobacter sp. KTW20L]